MSAVNLEELVSGDEITTDGDKDFRLREKYLEHVPSNDTSLYASCHEALSSTGFGTRLVGNVEAFSRFSRQMSFAADTFYQKPAESGRAQQAVIRVTAHGKQPPFKTKKIHVINYGFLSSEGWIQEIEKIDAEQVEGTIDGHALAPLRARGDTVRLNYEKTAGSTHREALEVYLSKERKELEVSQVRFIAAKELPFVQYYYIVELQSRSKFLDIFEDVSGFMDLQYFRHVPVFFHWHDNDKPQTKLSQYELAMLSLMHGTEFYDLMLDKKRVTDLIEPIEWQYEKFERDGNKFSTWLNKTTLPSDQTNPLGRITPGVVTTAIQQLMYPPSIPAQFLSDGHQVEWTMKIAGWEVVVDWENNVPGVNPHVVDPLFRLKLRGHASQDGEDMQLRLYQIAQLLREDAVHEIEISSPDHD